MFLRVPEWMGYRHYVAMQGFLGLLISYVLRFILSIALTEMSNATISTEDLDSCPIPEGYNTTVSQDKEFNWSEEEKGLVNTAFFWGYCLMQLPGGIIADRWDANKVITLGSIGTSLFTLLTPLSARLSQWQGLVSVRIILGMCQGLVYAAMHTLVGLWIPKEEMGKWGSFIFSGIHIGNTLNMFFTGLFLQNVKGGWPYVFYFCGTLGMIWSFFFYFTTYSSPQKHPNLSEAEKRIFRIDEEQSMETKRKLPWREILKSRAVWGASLAMIGHDFALFAMITQFPKFMQTVFHFNVKKNGTLNSLGYLSMWTVSILSGYMVDFLNNRKLVSLTANRKIGATLSSVGPAILFTLSVYVGCDARIAVTCVLLGQALMGFYYSSLKINSIDLTKNYTGTVSAIVSATGITTGIYVPYLIGALTPNNALKEWRAVMWVAFSMLMVTNLIYVLIGSAERQPWDSDKKSNDTESQVKKSNINVGSFKKLDDS